MERWTETRHGDTMLRQCFVCTEPAIAESCARCDHTCKAIMRLAEYEDTGMTPEEVQQLKLYAMGKAVAEIKEFDGVSIDLLRALAAHAKEDRLLVLPCAIGTPVFVHEQLCNVGKSATFDGCKYAQDCMRDNSIKCPLRVVKRAFTVNMRKGLGITFWLTQKEAEDAIPADRRP